jgi:lactoylglutathione lyase
MVEYRCDHVHLKANNIEETVRWYCDVVGGKITFEGQFKGSKVYYVNVSGTDFIIYGKLEDEEALPSSIKPRFGVDHFGFAVDDLDAALADLRAKNVTILEGPLQPRPNQRIAYIEAPDQVRIELTERKKN